ncbi:MAG: hypothetical protein GC138_00300 [Gammaproteobacteria bacterium]|nr:hypothetical protein [Gammaproteobacteria bacterium]
MSDKEGPVVALIAAVARNGVIGDANALPWHLPADMRHFRERTMGKTIIMGRKTAESLGKALPGRDNVVVTRQRDFQLPGMSVVHSLDDALNGRSGEVMIIGGAEIYRQALAKADLMYLTLIEADIHGDTTFPPYAQDQWEEVETESHAADQKNPYPYRFVTLQKRRV